MKFLILYILFFFKINFLFSQKEDKVVIPTKYGNFSFRGQVFSHGSNYLLIGLGGVFDQERKMKQISGRVAYHIRLKNYHFQMAYHTNSDEWFLNRSFQTLHEIRLGTGIRKDEWKKDMAIFIGPSLSYGDAFMKVNDKEDFYHFSTVGAYIDLQFTRKYIYDIGLGTSVFASFNKYYTIYGIDLHIYFSAAYKKKAKSIM